MDLGVRGYNSRTKSIDLGVRDYNSRTKSMDLGGLMSRSRDPRGLRNLDRVDFDHARGEVSPPIKW